MKIILLNEVENLGDKNEVKNVASGYARNYLIPRGLAEIASDSNLRNLENRLKYANRREERLEQKLGQMVDKVNALKIEIKAKSGVDGKLYGSVTGKQIAEALTQKLKVEIDKKRITIETAIKQTGEYKIGVSLGKGKKAVIELNVAPDGVPVEPVAEKEAPAAAEKPVMEEATEVEEKETATE